MAVQVPIVGHVHFWSLLADIREDLPGCSIYENPAVSATDTDNLSSSPHSGPLGFLSAVSENVNLAQFEVLLRAFEPVDWLYQLHKSRLTGSIKILLKSGILLRLALDSGMEIRDIEINHLLTSHIKKKQVASCAISDNLLVLAFLASDLMTLRLTVGYSDVAKNAVCTFRRRSKKADEFDTMLMFNETNSLLLYSFAPKFNTTKKWLPKRSSGSASWTLEVYACNPSESTPLQRLHKMESPGQQGDSILKMTFMDQHPDSFLLATQINVTESTTEISVQRYTIDAHSLRPDSSACTSFGGKVLACDVHRQTGCLAIGLSDQTVLVFDGRKNELIAGQCNVRPDFLKWNTDQTLLAVASAESVFQIFDRALQSLPATLVNDTCNFVSGLRLRNCVNSITSLTKLDWVHLPSNADSNLNHFASGLLLYFERGPIGILCLGSSPQHDTTAKSILHYWISQQKFHEAVTCLSGTGHDLPVKELITSARTITSETISNCRNHTEVSSVLQMLLGWLSRGHSGRTDAEMKSLQGCYSTLLRRVFGYLVRIGDLRRTEEIATSYKDPKFLKMVQNARMEKKERGSLASVESPLTPTAPSFDGSDGSLSSSLCTVIENLNSTGRDNNSSPVTIQESLSWTDLGEI